MGDLGEAGLEAGLRDPPRAHARAAVEHQRLALLAGQVARLEGGHRRQQRALDVLEGVFLRRADVDDDDLVAVEGPVRRTKTGEVTIWAERLVLLCKSLNPMPEKFHGLTDTEARYRQRYLDLMTNPESMRRFRQRSEIIAHFRRVLADRGFDEVETP
ncbi:MAG: hypothetical protein GVY27_07580, partial [Deinococcus-Thermus bacterium]|nr:hypothetical protein [Deinococcota bacterium]